MRTAIFLGLTAIADAIRKDWLTDKDVITFGAIILIVIMTMDIWEFIIKIRKAS
jgi:phosphate starvation-inducible membrane PsiE